MAIIYIGVGSNLGNRMGNIEAAYVLLEKNGIKILKRSSIIETEPVGGPPQEKYLNAVIEAETALPVSALLMHLKRIEKEMGRIDTVRNGPRPIDLDILFYDHLTINTSQLTIPHPRMFDRDFVMKPLKEIAPEMTRLGSCRT